MFQALHDCHFVHDPLGIIDDLLARILQPHLHHLFHGVFLASGYIVDQAHNATGPTAQLLAHIVLALDHPGQVVGEIRFHVVEHKQFVLGIQDADNVIGTQDAFVAQSNQFSTDERSIARLVLLDGGQWGERERGDY